jgi:hypothetical protein
LCFVQFLTAGLASNYVVPHVLPWVPPSPCTEKSCFSANASRLNCRDVELKVWNSRCMARSKSQRFVHDEERRTRVHDRRHHQYSSAAAAAADRAGRLTKSIGELRTALAASRLEHAEQERQLSFRAGTSTPLSAENATTSKLSFSPRRQSPGASAASALPVTAAE